jgi:hypothetical protein
MRDTDSDAPWDARSVIPPPGSYTFGPQNGRIVVRTYREGLAQAIGHDLVIEVGPFTAMMGALKVADRVDIEFEVDLPP